MSTIRTVQGNLAGRPATPSTVERTDEAGGFGQQTFLKLLIAQMSHQDPTSPTDSSQMMAQMAQFATVEGINNLQKQLTALNLSQDFTASTALIGRTVTWHDEKGAEHSGVVDHVTPDPKGAILHVGDAQFYSGQIASVS